MAGPYRESEAAPIDCPRCTRPLVPGALASCSNNCGVWVAAQTAHDLLDAAELAPSRLTTWFRELAPCPHCSQMMTLRGYDMSLFQGCDAHGFWIDNDTIGQTGLGRAAHAPLLKRARADAEAMWAEHERAELMRRAQAKDAAALRAAALEAARRDAEQREYAARIEAARREAELAPYLRMLHELTRRGDPIPLASLLHELDRTIAELRKRIEDLEARGQVTLEQ